MALASIIRSGVAIANRITADLQVDVEHRSATLVQPEPETNPDGTIAYAAMIPVTNDGGAPELGDPVRRPALFERKTRVLRGFDGQEHVSHGKVTFLSNVLVTPYDEIVPPDGHKGPILTIGQLADPAGGGYLVEVWLGSRGQGV